MRFHVHLEVDVDVPDLVEAQEVFDRIGQAAHAAAGEAAVRDEQGALWRAELTPLDAAARQALADDGLGPGISSAGFPAG